MSDGRFSGRRALVTGAGSGIGRAAARRLADEGAEVVGLDLDGDGLATTFEGRPAARWEALDIAADAALAALHDHGPFDVLVNGAGILRRHHLLDHTLEDWHRTLDVNVRAPFRLLRDFARVLVDGGERGAAVNVCSIESFGSLPAHAAYTASKTALLLLTRAFALELAPHGVRINGIAPGATETGMNADLRSDPARAAQLCSAIPLGRFGLPEEQAAAICFLVSDEASYITGSVLGVDGGWLTR